MGMYPGKFVKAFAERTRKNLKVIEDLKNNRNLEHNEVFEITQLVNSCLGLLVFPRQRYFAQISETKLSDLHDWPIPNVKKGEVAYLKAMIENMRHAIAHCNLEFIGDDINGIQGLRMWNSKTQWEVEWRVEDLRKFVIKFSDMLIQE
jgi:hypothetical protein